jgi:hypothetical protein
MWGRSLIRIRIDVGVLFLGRWSVLQGVRVVDITVSPVHRKGDLVVLGALPLKFLQREIMSVKMACQKKESWTKLCRKR